MYSPGDVTPSWPVPDPDFEIRGGARSDLKIREGQVPRAPPLDPPLLAVPLICLFLIGQKAEKYAGVFKENIVYQ